MRIVVVLVWVAVFVGAGCGGSQAPEPMTAESEEQAQEQIEVAEKHTIEVDEQPKEVTPIGSEERLKKYRLAELAWTTSQDFEARERRVANLIDFTTKSFDRAALVKEQTIMLGNDNVAQKAWREVRLESSIKARNEIRKRMQADPDSEYLKARDEFLDKEIERLSGDFIAATPYFRKLDEQFAWINLRCLTKLKVEEQIAATELAAAITASEPDFKLATLRSHFERIRAARKSLE